MPTSYSPEIIAHAGSLLARYDVLLCDIWGVVHDGKVALPASNDALTRFRSGGGTVILVSNAPVPPDAVARLLDDKAVPRSAWDRIVSSGGLALNLIHSRGYRHVHRIGPAVRDALFFAGLPPDAPLAKADVIACTGPFDDRRETGEDYRARLVEPAKRGVPLVCANPDLVVHVGHDLLPCAGAIGVVYESLGGKVVWPGKPHPIAYRSALEMAADLRGFSTRKTRVLAIGDAVRTDLAAAAGAGVDALFIASGIHRDAVLVDGRIGPQTLEAELRTGGFGATAAMVALVW